MITKTGVGATDHSLPLNRLCFCCDRVGALVLPDWFLSQTVIAFARALAVLGLLVMWRTGLVSFGHALYFGLGAYSTPRKEFGSPKC